MFKQVFTNQAADGHSDAAPTRGGIMELVVAGNLGGGTVQLEAYYPEVGEWVPVDGGTWTTAAVKVLDLGQRPCDLRYSLTGSTAASVKGFI